MRNKQTARNGVVVDIIKKSIKKPFIVTDSKREYISFEKIK